MVDTETFARNLARLGATGHSADELIRGHRVLAERQRQIDEFLREVGALDLDRRERRSWLRLHARLRRLVSPATP